jgi:hypothetical protein
MHCHNLKIRLLANREAKKSMALPHEAQAGARQLQRLVRPQRAH